MSSEIENHFIKQFTAGITQVAQQDMSRLRGRVRNETMKGTRMAVDYLGTVSMDLVQSRHQDTPLSDTPHSRRWVLSDSFVRADMVDDEDKIRVLNDPTNDYSVAMARAAGRKLDELVLDAFFATAVTGVDAAGTQAFDTAPDGTDMTVDDAAAAALTVDKLREAKRLLDHQEVDEMGRHVAITAGQLQNLLAQTEITSMDFNTVRALVSGEVNAFLGFNFVRTELVGAASRLDSSGNERIPCWQQDGMLLAMGMNPQGSIDRRPDKMNNVQVMYRMDGGATRLQETHVVEILCAVVALT